MGSPGRTTIGGGGAVRERVWLFDLDNTLHDASPHIFPHINRAMTAYMQEHLALDLEGANALRAHYWRTYGATLLGVVRHHAVDPRHFLWHTHQFPELARMVIAEAGLLHALRRLPGRKIIFSNAPSHYASAVLGLLGIARLFDAVYAIEHVGFQPKPGAAAFRALLAAERLDARRCVMVEDTAENLRTAKRLGMRTVLVSRASRTPSWVDARVASVTDLPRIVPRLGRAG